MLSVFQQADIIDFVKKIFKDIQKGSIKNNKMDINKNIQIKVDKDGEISICCRDNTNKSKIKILHTFNVNDYNEEEDLREDIEKELSKIINKQKNTPVSKIKKNKYTKHTQQPLLNVLKDNLITSIETTNNTYKEIDRNIYNNIDWKNYTNYIKQNKMKKHKKSLLHLYVKRLQQATQKANLDFLNEKAKYLYAFENRKKFIKMKKQQDKRNKKINEKLEKQQYEQFIKQQVESLQNEPQEVESLQNELKSRITHQSTNNPIIQNNTIDAMKASTFFKKLERFNEICLKNTLKPKDHYRLTY